MPRAMGELAGVFAMEGGCQTLVGLWLRSAVFFLQ